MANNTSSRQACHAARYVVARVLRGLFWCLKYAVISATGHNGPDGSVCFYGRTTPRQGSYWFRKLTS
uniref:conjugal transfer protein TraP n=1 Tax=Escherichia coli TaxID=562 RepID=UPI00202B3F02|nr:conjugal transfer protein TraP [Escherichia coli]